MSAVAAWLAPPCCCRDAPCTRSNEAGATCHVLLQPASQHATAQGGRLTAGWDEGGGFVGVCPAHPYIYIYICPGGAPTSLRRSHVATTGSRSPPAASPQGCPLSRRTNLPTRSPPPARVDVCVALATFCHHQRTTTEPCGYCGFGCAAVPHRAGRCGAAASTGAGQHVPPGGGGRGGAAAAAGGARGRKRSRGRR